MILPACCARAASGHAAAPPSSVMNSRRLIVALRGQNTHGIVSQPSGSWNGVRGMRTATNCFWVGMLALDPRAADERDEIAPLHAVTHGWSAFGWPQWLRRTNVWRR